MIRGYLQQHDESREERFPPSPPKIKRSEILRRMTEDLQLTDTQQKQIEVIITDHQKKMSELWDGASDQSRELFHSMRREIVEKLNEEQKERFYESLKQRRSKRGSDHNHEKGKRPDSEKTDSDREGTSKSAPPAPSAASNEE